jgi:hypothetical protein
MRKRKFTNDQRKRILKETGLIIELAERHGVSKNTIYTWRRKLAPRKPLRYKSDVYEWMEARYAVLLVQFAKTPPGWSTTAKKIADEGLRNRDGSLPNGGALKQTWLRVCDAKEREARSPPAPIDRHERHQVGGDYNPKRPRHTRVSDPIAAQDKADHQQTG